MLVWLMLIRKSLDRGHAYKWLIRCLTTTNRSDKKKQLLPNMVLNYECSFSQNALTVRVLYVRHSPSVTIYIKLTRYVMLDEVSKLLYWLNKTLIVYGMIVIQAT